MFVPTWRTRLREWPMRFTPSKFKKTPLPQLSDLVTTSHLIEERVQGLNDINTRRENTVALFEGAPEPWLHRLLRDVRDNDTSPLFNWSLAVEGLPPSLESPFANLISECRDDISYTEWVLWYLDGRMEILTPEHSIGWSNEDGSCRFVTRSPKAMPEGVVKAAQLTRGAFDNERGTYGVVWVLYHV